MILSIFLLPLLENDGVSICDFCCCNFLLRGGDGCNSFHVSETRDAGNQKKNAAERDNATVYYEAVPSSVAGLPPLRRPKGPMVHPQLPPELDGGGGAAWPSPLAALLASPPPANYRFGSGAQHV